MCQLHGMDRKLKEFIPFTLNFAKSRALLPPLGGIRLARASIEWFFELPGWVRKTRLGIEVMVGC